MHSKQANAWKGIVLRRREMINEMALNVEVAQAQATGHEVNLEDIQKQRANDKAPTTATLLGRGLAQMRRKKSTKQSTPAETSKSTVKVKNRSFAFPACYILCTFP